MEHTQETSQETLVNTVQYAGFWRRLLSYILDSIIIAAAAGIFFGFESREMSPGIDIFSELGSSLGPIALSWLYFAFMESSKFQGTLGKMALNIKVTDMTGGRISFGTATGRYFAKILSALTLMIGYLMIIWTQKKQGLHDKIAKTLVVKT
jgi:uncharacterized RDD family membrane protein YckC